MPPKRWKCHFSVPKFKKFRAAYHRIFLIWSTSPPHTHFLGWIDTFAAGNILLSYAVLMVGGSIGKVLLIFKHMGLAAYSARTMSHASENLLCIGKRFPI